MGNSLYDELKRWADYEDSIAVSRAWLVIWSDAYYGVFIDGLDGIATRSHSLLCRAVNANLSQSQHRSPHMGASGSFLARNRTRVPRADNLLASGVVSAGTKVAETQAKTKECCAFE